MMPVHHCSYHNSCQQQRPARPATTPLTSPPPAHHCTKAIQSSANPVSTFRLTVLGLNRSPLHPNKLNELQSNCRNSRVIMFSSSSFKQPFSRASKTERPLSRGQRPFIWADAGLTYIQTKALPWVWTCSSMCTEAIDSLSTRGHRDKL